MRGRDPRKSFYIGASPYRSDGSLNFVDDLCEGDTVEEVEAQLRRDIAQYNSEFGYIFEVRPVFKLKANGLKPLGESKRKRFRLDWLLPGKTWLRP